MRGSRPLSSLRDWRDRLAHLLRQRARQRLELAPRRRRESAACMASRSASGIAAQAGCAARAAAALAAHAWRRRRRATSAISAPVAGLWIFSVVMRSGSSRRGARGGEKSCEHRRVVDRWRCRAGRGTRGATARRPRSRAGASGSPRPCRRRAARLDHEARRQVLDALVVDAVDLRARHAAGTAAPAACRARFDRVEIVLVARQCRGASSASGQLRGDVLVQRAAERTLISCKPRQTPNTGLPASTKALTSSIS